MAYRLIYPDKYQLWNALVRGEVHRLFIATNEKPPLGSEVNVEIQVEDKNLYFIVKAIIIGRRGYSKRFEPGVFVRIPDDALQECQSYLGIEFLPDLGRRARRALRVHTQVAIRFLVPAAHAPGVTKNISQTGMFVTSEINLAPGQQVRVQLEFANDPLQAEAEVVWSDPDQKTFGLEFVNLADQTAESLRDHIAATYNAQTEGHEREPKPILVADDDQGVLDTINHCLVEHGFEVFRAQTGVETLELVRQLHPSLLILDILMPQIDGAEICKIMRGDAEWVDIPIIFVSALEQKILDIVAQEAGATDYLTKPINLHELLGLVRTYLKEEQTPKKRPGGTPGL